MARRLFDTEAEVLYQLGNHPQIPTLLAHFEDNQEFYLAQEFIEGTHLSREFVKGVSWPQTRVILLMQEVLKVLSFVHGQQVIHRDIKPSNLIRRFQDNRIVLIDFGAVKNVSSSPLRDFDTGSTNLTVAIGTQGYMPNEQYAGKPRYSSDVYAVGMLGIRALTGIHPKKIEEDPITGELAWRHYAPSVDPALAAVIDRMVKYDFRDRYPTAVEALDALDNLPDSRQGIFSISGTSYPANAVTVKTKFGRSNHLTVVEHVDEDAALDVDEGGNTVIFDNTASTFSYGNGNGRGKLNGRGGEVYPLLEGQVVDIADHATPQLVGQKRHVITGLVAAVGLAAVASTILVALQSPPRPLSLLLPAVSLPEIPNQALSVLSPEAMATFQADRADQLFQQGNATAALTAYEDAIKSKPDYAPAHLGRCMTFLTLNKPDEALVACNDALAYRDYFPEAVRSKGNALEMQGKLITALDYYQEANRQMPSMAAAWLDRGRVLQALGRSAEAIQALDRAIALNRESVEAWTIRGKANWALRRYDQAIVDLDKALMLKPDHAAAVEMRRDIRRQLGR